MKFAFSTNAYTKKTLSFAIKDLANIGYKNIEIVADSPHAFLPLKQSLVNSIKKNLQNNKIGVSNLNANTVVGYKDKNLDFDKFEPSLSNSNSKLRKWRINYSKQAVDLAYELNIQSISLTSGSQKQSKIKELKYFQESLNEIATYAEKKNILIAIEYEPGLLIGSFEDVLPCVMNGWKNIGVNLDICHASVLHENISLIIKKLKQKLFHIHVSDCKDQIHYHLIPGMGEVDFKSMYLALKEINYNGFLTAELYPYDNEPNKAAKEAFVYLRNLVN